VIIVDTTVWIDYIGGRETPHAAWLDAAIPVTRLGLTDIILCEILQGVRGEAQARRLAFEMARFEIFATGGTELSVAAAANYRALLTSTFWLCKYSTGNSLEYESTGFQSCHRFLSF